jgi:hypothetical protein
MPTCLLNVDFLIGLKLVVINRKHNILFIRLYLWLNIKTSCRNPGIFNIFFLTPKD